MELLLLKLVGLVRPLAAMEYAEALFAALGVGLFALLLTGVLVNAALRRSLRLSLIDGVIFAFSGWCIATSLIYMEGTRIEEVTKLLIPVLSYTLVKNVIPDAGEYRRLLFWIILGFSVPTLVSATLIATGSTTAVEVVNYWTQLPRWKGAYTGSHNFGHSMTLLIMTMVLYVTLRMNSEGDSRGRLTGLGIGLLGLLGVVALYCLYMSLVRTAVVGLLTFLAIYSYAANKRLFVVGAVIVASVAIVTSPYWLVAFNPELGVVQHGRDVDAMDIGSGRPRLWLNDITVFAERPIDEQLAGAGIGNRRGSDSTDQVYGHNDWLEMLTQTGLVGLLLFLAIQLLMLRRILQLTGKERHMFLALYVAVNVMMFISNSYAWRIQVSQLYYMLLAFIEIPSIRTRASNPSVAATARGAA